MKRKYAFLAACLIALFLLWYFRPISEGPQISTSPTNQVSAPQIQEHETTIEKSQSSSVTKQNTAEEVQARIEERLKQREIDIESGKDEWRTPIEFYGKVVDESENPVPDAQIIFGVNDLSKTGSSDYKGVSDASGFFSIKGIQGKLLVIKVSKAGYSTSKRDNDSFYYAGQNVNFIPDFNNPIIFHLRKKGIAEPLVVIDFPGFAKIAKLPRNGGPIELDLMKGIKVQPGSGHIRFEFSGDKIEKTTGQLDLRLHISVPQGGIVRTDEEFNFQAPEEGYEPAIEIDMPTSTNGWYSRMTHNYFIRLPSGNYGRIEFMFMARNGVFTVQSFINPSGSRNLEYNEAVQPKQTVFE